MGDARPSYALISVADKRGLVEFAGGLSTQGFALIATGGSAKTLLEAGLCVIEAGELTGWGSLFDGRVKTLHPRIHAGILARPQDMQTLVEREIVPIDLVAVNFYPFEEHTHLPLEELVEYIDIGGPSMLRAAAKNQARVTVLADPDDYPAVLDELRAAGAVGADTRRRLAAKAFARSAAYEAAIAAQLNTLENPNAPVPPQINPARSLPLRYGENPHQPAAFYPITGDNPWRPLQGEALSYNNLLDADSAWRLAHALRGQGAHACVIVKHATPCGAALGKSQAEAYERAYQADPESAFGGIVAFSSALESATCEALADHFIEVLLAPEVPAEAAAKLSAKPRLRVLETAALADQSDLSGYEWRSIAGGLLAQQSDSGEDAQAQWRSEGRREPTEAELQDLRFAWAVARAAKSNAIVYARGGCALGLGAGQTSRVQSARTAAARAAQADLSLEGAVLASDGFLPFADTVEQAAALGITAIIQPGGSKRDGEVIAQADQHEMALVFTGRRHFRH